MAIIKDQPNSDVYEATADADVFVFNPRDLGENFIFGFEYGTDRVVIAGNPNSLTTGPITLNILGHTYEGVATYFDEIPSFDSYVAVFTDPIAPL
jgi:hypothetical protein